ncbi:MAG: hypothetical protein ACHQXA_01070 [Gemmatimonadales bacterium]
MVAGCRGEAPIPPGQAELTHLVDSLAPLVEHATGLKFRHLPRAVLISREQVRVYLEAKFRQEFPGHRARDLQDTYRLLTLLPDSTDLSKLLLGVLTEQVAGFYDPDSVAFFGVEGASPAVRTVTVAHELVHALQHNYVPLDSIMDQKGDADRLLAAQAILEGQATIAMFRMQPSIGDKVLDPQFWQAARDQLAVSQSAMPAFAAAPRVLREDLVFPYFSGAEFMRWWMTTHPDSVQPYGERMPRSSEQILLPSHYLSHDAPVAITFSGGPADSAESDVLGDFDTRVLLAEVRGQAVVSTVEALGWGGDRYIIYEPATGGPALVWVAVWDSPVARDGFLRMIRDPWLKRQRPGYRMTLESIEVDGHPGTRLVHAPVGWPGWGHLPVPKA